MRNASPSELGTVQPSSDEPFGREAARALEDLLAVVSRCMAFGCRWPRRGIGRVMLSWQQLPYPETSWHAEPAGTYVASALRERGFARDASSYI